MPTTGQITLDTVRFRRAVEAFVNRHGPEAFGPVARKIAFDVITTTTQAIGGGAGLPRRVDTDRYRAAWHMAQGNLGPATGSTAAARAGDGKATHESRPGVELVTAANNVEYGPEVEHGTARMRPGLHLRTAIERGTREAPDEIEAAMHDAWGD